MEEFLKPTEWCESDHPDIVGKAQELTAGLEDDRTKAMALYEFVRSLPYMLGPTRSAVEALKAGEGVCASKANLLVGLLRAAGIPARYHHFYYDKQASRSYIPAFMHGKLEPHRGHSHVEVYLDGLWVKIDATFDEALLPDRSRLWDGKSDIVAFRPEEIIEDLGPSRTLKADIFVKPPMPPEMLQMIFEMVNLYFDSIRMKNELERRLAKFVS
jgi:transglutaminase-like putative cysteine protease